MTDAEILQGMARMNRRLTPVHLDGFRGVIFPITSTDRAAVRAWTLAKLNERFTGLTQWPAAEVRAIAGFDPTTISSIAKTQLGASDIPKWVAGVGFNNVGVMSGSYGDNALTYTVLGTDVLSYVSTQP